MSAGDLTELEVQTGRASAQPPPLVLSAGPLRCAFQDATVRWIRFRGVEVVRGIYAAVRDRNWATVPASLHDLHVHTSDAAFTVEFGVDHQAQGIAFSWQGRVEATARCLTFSFDGKAHSGFLRNRIGFCVLHPPGCAGQACTVTHTDGRITESHFPRQVAPNQPFLNMRSITHEPLPSTFVTVEMSGDVFEMEDQRNWTDASYKTYCTPLAEPFPVEVPAGTRVRQTVRITMEEPRRSRRVASTGGAVVDVRLGGVVGRLPRLGVGADGDDYTLTSQELARCSALQLAHLRVAPRPAQLAMAAALGVPAEAAVSDDMPDHPLAEQVRRVGAHTPLARWVVDAKVDARAAAEQVRGHGGGGAPAPVFVGTRHFFTELNRNRPPLDCLDGVCFSINPQVHAFDDASMAETIGAQGDVVRSARRLARGAPVAVTPVTLRMRENPNATAAEPLPAPGQLPRQVDPRQPSLWCAAWTAGSVGALAAAGAACVTYFQLSGWLGIMSRQGSPARSGPVAAWPGGVFPTFHVLRDLSGSADAPVLRLTSSLPDAICGVALRTAHGVRVLLGNLSDSVQQVRLSGRTPMHWRGRRLDAGVARAAATDPEGFHAETGGVQHPELELPAYSVLRLDGSASA